MGGFCTEGEIEASAISGRKSGVWCESFATGQEGWWWVALALQRRQWHSEICLAGLPGSGSLDRRRQSAFWAVVFSLMFSGV